MSEGEEEINQGSEYQDESLDGKLDRPSVSGVDDESEAGGRVIRKGAARLIVSTPDQVASGKPTEPRAIRPQPRVAVSAKVKPELVDELEDEVLRLERKLSPGKNRIKVGAAKFDKLEERPTEDVRQEEQWGHSAGGGWKMLLVGGCVVIVLVISLVVMRGVWGGDTMKDEDVVLYGEEEKEKNPYEGSPEKWFHDRSGTISAEALHVLEGFVQASDRKAKSQWVRRPEQYLNLSPHWPVQLDPLMRQHGKESWSIGHTDGVAYLILETRNREFLPLRVYFTHIEGVFKLDWQASMAWSEVSLEEIRSVREKRGGPRNEIQRKAGVVASEELIPSSKSVLPDEIYTASMAVRCMLRKKEEFYAGPYNDREYSGYMLLSADKMHYMWGYVAKDSALDSKLKAILDHGSFVVRLKKDERVILRVRLSKKDALASQLEIVELTNSEWVNP